MSSGWHSVLRSDFSCCRHLQKNDIEQVTLSRHERKQVSVAEENEKICQYAGSKDVSKPAEKTEELLQAKLCA